MTVTDREKEIVRVLSAHGETPVEELARALYVSPSTVRRALRTLEEKNLVIHSYGKVRLCSHQAWDTTPYQMRDSVMADVKEALAIAVANSGLVESGQVVMLDASTTVSHLTGQLKSFVDITVITSGIRSMLLLDELEIPFISTGGVPVPRSHSLTGQHALDVISAYNADICFLSCHGLSADGYLTDPSVSENHVRRAMMQKSRQTVLVLDSSKLNKSCFHNLCHISAFDHVFCNAPLPEHIAKTVKNFHLVEVK